MDVNTAIERDIKKAHEEKVLKDRFILACTLFERGKIWVEGKRVRFDFGKYGVVLLDGKDCKVTKLNALSDIHENVILGVDTSLVMNWKNFVAMLDGHLDPFDALIGGKMYMEGDKMTAEQLNSIITKLNTELKLEQAKRAGTSSNLD